MKRHLFIMMLLLVSVASASLYWTGNFTQTSQDGIYTASVTAENDWFIVQENEKNFTVGDVIPSTPTLLTPTDNNTTVQLRKPVFTWQAGEGMTPEYYTINISSPCTSIPLRNTTQTNYTSIEELCTEETYNWTIRACVGEEECSDWAQPYNFSIQSILGIELEQNTTSFGTLMPSTEIQTIQEDTLDSTPSPLQIRNTGNVRINVDAKANNALWTNQGLGTHYLQFADENSTDWINATTGYQRHTSTLMYNITREIEIRIQVPLGEPPGEKSATLQVLAEAAE